MQHAEFIEGLYEAVSKGLTARSWRVEVEPRVGEVRPDLLVTSPRGESYVVEIKLGDGPADLASIAQLANLRDTVALERPKVQAVLVTTRTLRPDVEMAAGRLGIDLIDVPSADAPTIAAAVGSLADLSASV